MGHIMPIKYNINMLKYNNEACDFSNQIEDYYYYYNILKNSLVCEMYINSLVTPTL